MVNTKSEWIAAFRSIGNSIFADLEKTKKSQEDKTSDINKRIKKYREQEIKRIKTIAKKDPWESQSLE